MHASSFIWKIPKNPRHGLSRAVVNVVRHHQKTSLFIVLACYYIGGTLPIICCFLLFCVDIQKLKSDSQPRQNSKNLAQRLIRADFRKFTPQYQYQYPHSYPRITVSISTSMSERPDRCNPGLEAYLARITPTAGPEGPPAHFWTCGMRIFDTVQWFASNHRTNHHLLTKTKRFIE